MPPSRPIVAHIIMSLDTGGAEESLRKLVVATQASYRHHVVSFGRESRLSRAIRDAGIDVVSLDLKQRGPLALWRAWRYLARAAPDVVQGWMYHGNLLGAVLRSRRRGTRQKLAWNVRHSPHDLASEKLTIRAAIRCVPYCRPDLVIYNSHDGAAQHQTLGYSGFRSVIIPNGVDTEKFKPDADARVAFRQSYDLEQRKLIAMVCRYHAQKRVDLFLRALAALDTDVAGLLIGPGMDPTNRALRGHIEANRVGDRVLLLGPRDDLEQVYPALDLLVIASSREGTPNVLLEAMACGVKAVATNVGDVERLVPDETRLVAVGDADDLRDKIDGALASCGVAVDDRRFVERNFGLDRCHEAYRSTYEALLAGQLA